MAKYRFRLATLQKLRERERDQRQAQLTEAYRAEEILQAQQRELADQWEALQQDRRAATAGKYLDLDTLTAAGRFEQVLKSREQVLLQQQSLLQQEVEKRKQRLVEAQRGVRALELLDERRRDEHQRAEQRAETKEMDEIACVRFWRRQKEKRCRNENVP